MAGDETEHPLPGGVSPLGAGFLGGAVVTMWPVPEDLDRAEGTRGDADG